jgi:phosphoglucomutase
VFPSFIEPETRKRIHTWLEGNYDPAFKNEIKQLINQKNFEELNDAFYRDLEFGTGGLRGVMGVGTNRMNVCTVGMATQGLSNYLRKAFPNEEIKVVIAHDSRNNAGLFSQTAADVFSGNGIKVYFFEGLRPTPELSFAIRELGCKSGIMLTASHNPKEYNGYKAYWSDGGQVVPPHDKNIIIEVNAITSIDQVTFEGNPSLIEKIGTEMDKRYIETIRRVSINPDVIKKQHNLKIVFSPIHGTAVTIVPEALKAVGFTNVKLVEEQCTPDGNFPTVVYPNPEEHEALSLSLKKGDETGADLVMATDPDADRVGVAVRDADGKFVLLNGNQAASLLIHYVLQSRKEKGLQTGRDYIVKTIVTTNLIDKIAEKAGVNCYNVLTGFKYIGELMTRLEDNETFVAGGEESYGYLVGSHVRDKDAVVSCTMIAEMAAFWKEKGKTLYEALDDLYLEYGFYLEKLISLTKKGPKGAQEIKQMMQNFREHPPKTLGGERVTCVKDYQKAETLDISTGKREKLDFPASNVIQFITEKNSLISARPSGTEPKIKFYISVNRMVDDKDELSTAKKEMDALISAIENDFMQL